jgi:DNA-binding XRE family transcriptional regulator
MPTDLHLPADVARLRPKAARATKVASVKPPKAIEPVYLAIGAKMVMMRNALGLTQDEFAKRIGTLTRTSIVNIEAGKQRILLHDIEKIATAFGTTPKHLLRGIWL